MLTLNMPRLLNGTHLKILALLTMTIDHIGLLLLGDYTPFRIVGRIAFPIFAYMIAEGCRYTRHKLRYFGLIFGLGILFQAVYIVIENSFYLNIMITLGLAIPIIYAVQFAKAKPTFLRILLPISLVALLFIIDLLAERVWLSDTNYAIDYTVAGVLLPVIISLSDNKKLKLPLAALGLILVAASMHSTRQLWSLLALIPLALYNGTAGKHRMKWLFYIYYPLHLVLIYGIALIF